MRNFVGSFDCIDKAKICPAAAICTTKTTIYPAYSAARKQSQQQRKRKEWWNITIWQPTISGGGNSVISGLTSVFHTSTKRRLLSCQRAIIAVFLRFLPLKAQDTSTYTSLMKPRKRPLSIPLLSATRVRALILTPAIANLSRSIWTRKQDSS